MKRTPSSARRITRSVFIAVAPTYCATSPDRSTSTRWPFCSRPTDAVHLGEQPRDGRLPGARVAEEHEMVRRRRPRAGRAASACAWTWRNATRERTCSLTVSSPTSASSSAWITGQRPRGPGPGAEQVADELPHALATRLAQLVADLADRLPQVGDRVASSHVRRLCGGGGALGPEGTVVLVDEIGWDRGGLRWIVRSGDVLVARSGLPDDGPIDQEIDVRFAGGLHDVIGTGEQHQVLDRGLAALVVQPEGLDVVDVALVRAPRAARTARTAVQQPDEGAQVCAGPVLRPPERENAPVNGSVRTRIQDFASPASFRAVRMPIGPYPCRIGDGPSVRARSARG